MIIGIGCDIVEHDISRKFNWETDIAVLKRIFSSNELKTYFDKKDLKYLCGRFAAKESILKCLGTGMVDGISLSDIQIVQTIEGAPKIILHGQAKKASDSKGINRWNISITHSNNYSIAFVTAED